ncbi:MAG: aromatic ring-hydroxylating dioxygenase subunit alpha [Bacteroidota bacterium]
MSLSPFHIDPDVSKAETLPALFYSDPEVFDALREKVFYKSWQWVGDLDQLTLPRQVSPFVLLDGFLTEPMLLSRDENDQVHCLSNVCTHRGNLVAANPGTYRKLVCEYHGRRFGLDGSFEHMPEFGGVADFPRPCDDLHRFPVEQWGPLIFANMGSDVDLGQVIKAMDEYVGFLPLHEFIFNANQSKDYLVNGHWALYCDNYLEGFHIPFVHKDLNAVLNYGAYETVIGDIYNLQVGYADGADDIFDLPAGHIHEGKRVAAYYFWLFPNMMFNFYPWGLSVNIVRPLTLNQTKVSFLTFIYDESKLQSGAGALLDKVEREDEFVVEGVHKGLKSKYYKAGRFSASREQGVHHFHRLLAEYLRQ